jgi:hypothetical protein
MLFAGTLDLASFEDSGKFHDKLERRFHARSDLSRFEFRWIFQNINFRLEPREK